MGGRAQSGRSGRYGKGKGKRVCAQACSGRARPDLAPDDATYAKPTESASNASWDWWPGSQARSEGAAHRCDGAARKQMADAATGAARHIKLRHSAHECRN